MEVGCGAGGILHPFQQAGYNTLGLDLDTAYLTHGRQKGLHLLNGTIHDLAPEPEPKPSLIIYNQVLEHILDLPRELQRLHALLRDDGCLFVAVPGIYSVRWNYFGDLLRYLQLPHVYHFNLGTISRLLRRFGFARHWGDERICAVFRKDAPAEAAPCNEYLPIRTFIANTERRRFYWKTITQAHDLRDKLVAGVARQLRRAAGGSRLTDACRRLRFTNNPSQKGRS